MPERVVRNRFSRSPAAINHRKVLKYVDTLGYEFPHLADKIDDVFMAGWSTNDMYLILKTMRERAEERHANIVNSLTPDTLSPWEPCEDLQIYDSAKKDRAEKIGIFACTISAVAVGCIALHNFDSARDALYGGFLNMM